MMFKEWIESPINYYHDNRDMCSCGDLRCHQLIHCHKCGTEFKLFKSISIAGIIKRKLNYFNALTTIRYYAAIYERQLKDLKIKPDWGNYFKKELDCQ